MFQLIAVKHHRFAVFFNHNQIPQLDSFKRGKTRPAFRTLAAAADSGVVLGISGIFNLRIVTPAKRTFHAKPPGINNILSLYKDNVLILQ